MPLSTSILRRYTPPTCTLEIEANASPLSRWVGRSVLKTLHFTLRFDDPRLSEENQVTLQGQAEELEALHNAVSSYVQNLLNTSPTELVNSSETPPPQNESEPHHTPPPVPPTELPSNVVAFKSPSPGTPITLKPNGLVAHELRVNHSSAGVIHLSTLQLFDLATALDEYAAEFLALPNLNSRTGKKKIPAWQFAAAAVVLVVGITAASIELLNRRSAQQATVQSVEPESDQIAQDPFLTEGVPPVPSDLDQITPIPSPNVPSTLSPGPTLPPPPGVEIPSQLPQRSRSNIPISPPPRRTDLPSQPTTPNAESGAVTSTIPIQPGTNGAASPNSSATSPAPTPSPLPEFPPPDPGTTSLELPSDIATRNATPSEGTPSPSGSNAEVTAANSLPQLAEVKSHFQQQWQPQESLERPLEYRIILAKDGTIQRIIPLGDLEGDYIDRSGMPLMGEPFVSPVLGSGNPEIRVKLFPDGTVETSLEAVRPN